MRCVGLAPPCGRDKSGPIRINLTPSPSTSVGARVAGKGGEGLDGRPSSLAATFTYPVVNQTGLRGRPSRPSQPPITTLAPTDHPTSSRIPWLRLMSIGRDKSGPICINLTTSPSTSVGARVAGKGGEGLDGRPSSLAATFTHPVVNQTGLRGRPSRPSQPPITTLAPTDHPTSSRIPWLRLMSIGRDKSGPIRINLTTSPSTSVGARVAGKGGEGLDGRPSSLAATFTYPVVNQTGLRGRP